MNATTHDLPPRRGNPLRWLTWGGAAVLLSLPAIAMRLHVEGVDWTASDFVVMGVLLGGACIAYEVAARLSGRWRFRAAAGVAILAGLLLAWANLAVGLVADGPNAYNLAFFGVLGLGVAGALLARFQATGLGRTLGVMALAHGAIVAAALLSGTDPTGAALSAAWLAPWSLAAWLFTQEGRRQKV